MPIRSRGKDKNPAMKWECTNRGCGFTKETYKPGASKGAKATLSCLQCGGQQIFELVEITSSDEEGIPK